MDSSHLKVPFPRQLSKKETLESLSHWKSSVRNYFRRSTNYSIFFSCGTKWNHSLPCYGFTEENKETLADNLECLLDTIASFLPSPYIIHKIVENSTSIQSVWDIIWEHYGVRPTQHSFLDFNNLKIEQDERYIDLYDKMIYHTVNHLCPAGTPLAESSPSPSKLEKTDILTTSHKNLIALNWLNAINPKLIDIVKLEYSKDLKAGIPLSSLVKTIAENIDSLMMRFTSKVNKIDSTENPDCQANVLRIANQRFPASSSSRGGRGQVSNYQHTRNQNQNNCNSCYSLGKRLSLYVNFRHNPSQCPQRSSIRSVQECTAETITEDQDQEKDPASDESPEENTGNITILPPSDLIGKIRNIETRLGNTSILKASSPSLQAYFKTKRTFCLIDEGSELCCIDFRFANSSNIKFSRTNESAVSAGSHSMKLMGQTDDPIIIQLEHNNNKIEWNLGHCIVVMNLGCPILIGEPGKSYNTILTDPVKRKITTLDVNKCPVSLPYINKKQFYPNDFICRINKNETVYSGEEVELDVPAHFKESEQVFFSPRQLTSGNFFSHQICSVKNGKVSIKNNNNTSIFVKKNSHFGDLTPSSPSSSLQLSSLQPLQASNLQLSNDCSTLAKVSIDPDNILKDKDKCLFQELIHEYSDTISSLPGCYNGYFGDVDCSINFIKDPPASLKARLPTYSNDKLVTMANLMDEMESMGVLSKPEDVGVIPRNVHTSYLVPKTDGTFRFVTDFTSLLPFIGKLEVVAPSIANAKRMISSFAFLAELDLTHCFWQGKMSPQDSQYLATPHPFGGIRVYTREPQGIRNASEHNSERLARIFGDLEQQGKMSRMADGLYVGGSSPKDLLENLRSVFHRARLCGLTFKPSKIVICPLKTILFGWEKNGNLWSPTPHVVTPLSQAPRPKTVKQLRGFIGAFRQLSSTIPNYSMKLGKLEKYTGGKGSREYVTWNQDMVSEFEDAKASLNDLKSIAIPTPEDTLHIYPDFSENANAIGSHLIIHKPGKDITRLNGGYFSVRLEDCQTRWTPCEKECLGIKLTIQHFKPYIQNSKNRTYIHTDNLICVQAWNRLKQGHISTSSKVASFLSSISENNIEIVHFPGTQTKVADFSSRNPLPCNISRCQICNYAFEQTSIGDIASIMAITVNDIEDGNYKIPLTEKPTWLKLQKQDETHRLLYRLITSGGLQPEPKLRGHTDLKRMYNLYKKGLLSIDQSGLITVKYIDGSSGVEYDAISVPKQLYPGLVQSIHIKLSHPSKNLMHKFLHC